ncbi:MAG: hypothetical protein K0Q99_1515 [Clostridia bacterium]|nr:hypothetical protein [Clostridia bacterium]
MPLNNEYKRYFIILQEDDKGYEMAAGKIPTGYAKIEIKNGKGKLTAYAQNVKYGEKVDYRMLLIAPTKKAAVDMGRLMVDGSGRGELNVEFDADNVMKSGMNISEFMVAAVKTNTATPLSGYTGRDKMQWKNAYHIVNKPQDRIDKNIENIEEVAAPVQTKPTEMPQLPKVTLGGVVEGAKDIVENVVEGAKDVVEGAKDVVEDFVGDVVEDVVEGAKNIVGGIKKGFKDVMEYVVDEDEVIPVPLQPMEEAMPAQQVIQPSPIKAKKEYAPIPIVTEPISMQPVIKTAPVKPKKEPVPIQVVSEPIVMQPVIEPEPILEPEPIPEPVVVPEPVPVKPVEMLPQKPLYEAQTEIKAKFVIEMEEQHEHKPKYEYEVQCPEIDYKNYYYDEDSDCDCDSDSDSDSDDRDKKKHHKEKEMEQDLEDHPYYSSPMYRKLEKVLGKLCEYDEDDDSKEKWFKIEDDIYLLNSATIPFMGSMMPLGYPFMCNECAMMVGRKEYILGAKYVRGRKDKKVIKAIMFGVPGMYNKQEERYYSMRGYTHFKPHKSKGYGHWIMAVDVVTGEIIMK